MTNNGNFFQALKVGMAGESEIAQWLIRRGYVVLPVYEKIINEFKGPSLFIPNGRLAAPDLLVFGKRETLWVEAKYKTAFTWWRRKQRFETGLDIRHYEDYLKVQELSGKQVWVLFLHRGGQAKDSPPSPAGLYGNSLTALAANESHRDDRFGINGMVYWAREVPDGGPLKLIADYPLA